MRGRELLAHTLGLPYQKAILLVEETGFAVEIIRIDGLSQTPPEKDPFRVLLEVENGVVVGATYG
jgi:hypothetical protein